MSRAYNAKKKAKRKHRRTEDAYKRSVANKIKSNKLPVRVFLKEKVQEQEEYRDSDGKVKHATIVVERLERDSFGKLTWRTIPTVDLLTKTEYEEWPERGRRR